MFFFSVWFCYTIGFIYSHDSQSPAWPRYKSARNIYSAIRWFRNIVKRNVFILVRVDNVITFHYNQSWKCTSALLRWICYWRCWLFRAIRFTDSRYCCAFLTNEAATKVVVNIWIVARNSWRIELAQSCFSKTVASYSLNPVSGIYMAYYSRI